MATRFPSVSGVQAGNVGSLGASFQTKVIPNPVIIAGQMEGFAASMKTWRPAFTEAIKEVIIPSIHENFAQEGRPEWAQLEAFTNYMREDQGFAPEHPILIRTGKLFNAATAFARWKVEKDIAFVKGFPTTAWYGLVHQTGAVVRSDEFGEIGIPARPFMMLQPGDIKDIVKIMNDYVGKKAMAAGFKVT